MISLEKHVQQLRNVIAKHTGSSMPQVQTIIFVLDSEQIASRYGRSFKLTSSTLIGLRDAMSCSGFLISDGTTWVSPPRYCDPHTVPSGYPNPTRYPVFISIPDPIQFWKSSGSG